MKDYDAEADTAFSNNCTGEQFHGGSGAVPHFAVRDLAVHQGAGGLDWRKVDHEEESQL